VSAILAAVRPDGWSLPLLIHVGGAMVLVGGIAATAAAQLAGWRQSATAEALVLARLAYRSVLFVAIPGWIVMRIGAEWIASKEGLDGSAVPSWVDVGYVTADPGGILLLAAAALAWLGVRRAHRGGSRQGWAARVSAGLVTVVLVGYLVAVWAMTAKPV
jgi:hypothetical protein